MTRWAVCIALVLCVGVPGAASASVVRQGVSVRASAEEKAAPRGGERVNVTTAVVRRSVGEWVRYSWRSVGARPPLHQRVSCARGQNTAGDPRWICVSVYRVPGDPFLYVDRFPYCWGFTAKRAYFRFIIGDGVHSERAVFPLRRSHKVGDGAVHADEAGCLHEANS